MEYLIQYQVEVLTYCPVCIKAVLLMYHNCGKLVQVPDQEYCCGYFCWCWVRGKNSFFWHQHKRSKRYILYRALPQKNLWRSSLQLWWKLTPSPPAPPYWSKRSSAASLTNALQHNSLSTASLASLISRDNNLVWDSVT